MLEFSNDGRTHTEGPAGPHYEGEHKRAGYHLFFNAFWLVSHFCLFQMYMRDSLHQTDHGVIIHVLPQFDFGSDRKAMDLACM